MSRFLGFALRTLAVVVVFTACNEAFAQPATVPKLASPEVVKFGLTGKPLNLAGVYIAVAKGYFKQSGITTEFVVGGGFNALLPPLATGEIDLAIGGVGAGLFNAIERGVRLRIVADVHTAFTGRSSIALMVRKDLIDSGQIKSFADFKGRTIGLTSRRTSLELVLLRSLRSAGLGPNDITFVVMPFPQINAAFAGHSLDIGYQVEPLVSVATAKKLAVRWKGLDELAPNYQNSFLVASESFAGRQDVARAWMIAYLRGVRDYNDAIFKNKDREAIIRILMDSTVVKDRAAYDHMVMSGIHPDGELNVQSIKELAEELRTAGDIKGTVPVDQIIDLSFVRYAQKVLGPYER